MASFEALNGKKCKTPLCWSNLDEALTLSPKLIQDTIETIRKIREYIHTVQSRQKSYANKRRMPLEFDVGDIVFLKVSLTKGIQKFGL